MLEKLLPEDPEPRRRLAITLGGIFLALLGVGVFLLKTSDFEDGVSINDDPVLSATDVNIQIWVDVEGAVNYPGVYKLPQGSRVEDGLKAAGGLSEEADLQWVEKNVNRAAQITDGYKLYIPGVDDKQDINVNEVQGNVISLNNSSQEELEKLPGVGPVTAKKIIDGRPYSTTEDLTGKNIIGEKLWQQIKDQVQLW